MSDEALIAAYRENQDKKLVGVLYERHAHLAFGTAMKYLKNTCDADDIVMQVFEKLLKELLVKDVQQFKPWLYVVVKNQCLMQLRKKRGPQEIIKELEDKSADEVAQKVQLEEKLLEMEGALSQLKPHQATCIQLFYLEELCYQEIVERTGFDLKKVKSYIQNGKRNLQLMLEKR